MRSTDVPFAASMASLGFDEADGAIEIKAKAPPSKDVQKAEAKAHAKQYRKERRGERRSRTTGTSTRPAKSRGPTKGKGSPKPVKR